MHSSTHLRKIKKLARLSRHRSKKLFLRKSSSLKRLRQRSKLGIRTPRLIRLLRS
jgi:hypothetical protein